MDRRTLLVAGGVSLTTALAGCSGGGESDDDAGSTDDATGGDVPDEPRSIEEPAPLEFSGTGPDVIEVELEGGLTGVEALHDGSSDFVVMLLDGGFPTTFVDVLGQFEGAALDHVGAGEYDLEIVADGDWEVTVTQPRSATGADPALELSDSIPDYYGPFDFDGTYTVNGAHEGAGNFIMEVKGPGGRNLVINEIGVYDGATTFQYSGIGWIDVTAHDEWSIEIE